MLCKIFLDPRFKSCDVSSTTDKSTDIKMGKEEMFLKLIIYYFLYV